MADVSMGIGHRVFGTQTWRQLMNRVFVSLCDIKQHYRLTNSVYVANSASCLWDTVCRAAPTGTIQPGVCGTPCRGVRT